MSDPSWKAFGDDKSDPSGAKPVGGAVYFNGGRVGQLPLQPTVVPKGSFPISAKTRARCVPAYSAWLKRHGRKSSPDAAKEFRASGWKEGYNGE